MAIGADLADIVANESTMATPPTTSDVSATPAVSTGTRRIPLTPVSQPMFGRRLVDAPKKAKLASKLPRAQVPPAPEESEWFLADGRIGGYVFEKENQRVWLYTLNDKGESFSNTKHRVSFQGQEWYYFVDKFWMSLNSSDDVDRFQADMEGYYQPKSYYVFAAPSVRKSGRIIYVCESEYKYYSGAYETTPFLSSQNAYVAYSWVDLGNLTRIFHRITSLFNWSESCEGFQRLKRRIFAEKARDGSLIGIPFVQPIQAYSTHPYFDSKTPVSTPPTPRPPTTTRSSQRGSDFKTSGHADNDPLSENAQDGMDDLCERFGRLSLSTTEEQKGDSKKASKHGVLELCLF